MNHDLPFVPERSPKPRESGITMMMDKGLSLREAENFVASSGGFTDLVKFGFGTALITADLKKKIKVYREANMKTYFGGTLFEAFIIRNRFDEFRKFVDLQGVDMVEVSDGSMYMPHEEKTEYIRKLSGQIQVLSEVGYKVRGLEISHEKWVSMMKTELEAGSWKVIAEARESGTIGIYKSNGSADKELIDDIAKNIPTGNILWEAPNKSQQVWFIKNFGSNVNLGNVATADVVALETLRLGLRGDTFFDFLPGSLQDRKL